MALKIEDSPMLVQRTWYYLNLIPMRSLVNIPGEFVLERDAWQIRCFKFNTGIRNQFEGSDR
eukprot:snap_masked-scaffold_6-processed-gene-15.36-mRNA-1 protein AED:1.00 eAED:1.00 QI:0/0/0/0/1/1/2/0/61